jgi:hypothetical protein
LHNCCEIWGQHIDIFLSSGLKGQQREPLHDLRRPNAGRRKTFQGVELHRVPSTGVAGKEIRFLKEILSTEFQT